MTATSTAPLRGREMPGRVLLESWRGRRSDNPLALYELLVSHRPDLKLTWVTNQDSPGLGEVKRNTPRYFWELARTDYYVTNDMSPRYPGYRQSIQYLQTWHGTPLKRIGFDSFYREDKNPYLRRLAADVQRWKYLVSPSSEVSTILREAFRYKGAILETGYPRNDVLVAGGTEQYRHAARERIGVPEGSTCVLFMPTWRDAARDAADRPAWIPQFDPVPWLTELPDNYFILTRLHPVVHGRGGAQNSRVKDVTHYPDVTDLYLSADALVTDYSSAMFDFAVTGRPIIFYVWDFDTYTRSVRGTYFDLSEIAPGPLVEDPVELCADLGDLSGLADRHRLAYERFKRRFLPHEDGRASQRVMEMVFT